MGPRQGQNIYRSGYKRKENKSMEEEKKDSSLITGKKHVTKGPYILCSELCKGSGGSIGTSAAKSKL